ncbi:MAG: ABC transporter permease [Desulfobacterales bacterium]
MTGSLHTAFVRRQLLHPKKQTVLFLLCTALAVVSLVALGGFDDNIKRSVWRDAKALHGGDVLIRSRMPFSPQLEAAVTALQKDPGTAVARIWEFYSIARNAEESASLLSTVKVVEPGYPLYGEVVLESGAGFSDRLAPGTVIVERTLLDRLELQPGSLLRVGDAALTVADVVVREPDRPVNIFAMGPRIFVSSADLDALNLVGKGSRIRYKALLRVEEERRTQPLVRSLEEVAVERDERVESYRTAESRLQRFLDNFLFFLTMIGIFTLALAGIGIQVCLSAYFREQETSIAVMKALGATQRFMQRQFLAVVAVLGLGGSLIGIAAGLGLQALLPSIFQSLLPSDMRFAVSWQAIAEGLAVGLLLTALFTLLPLQRLAAIRPSAVFRKDQPPPAATVAHGMTMAGIGILLAILVLWRTRDVRTAAMMIGGGVAAIGIIALLTTGILAGIRRVSIRHLAMRQALRGLYRPRNATRAVVVTFTASLSLTAAIYLVETNLDAAFVQSFPPDTPNVFLIDIQPDQKTPVSRMIGPGALLYPNIRARLLSINGVPIDPKQERARKSDNLARTFNLTYREFLLEDERMKEGDGLFREEWGEKQVSVLDTIADIGGIRIGDRLRFRIQGVPLEAVVSSIRTRTREGLNPYFYFVFPESTLAGAPQTFFTGVRKDPDDIAGFQNSVVSAFPNISVIDLTQTLESYGAVLRRLARIIRFFSGFGMAAGALLIVSSILATRSARLREAVYFKVLGARKAFVSRVFFFEHATIALISAVQAFVLAELAAWFVCTQRFDVPYHPQPGFGLALALATVLLVTAVGMTASRSILNRKPMSVLKTQMQG